MSAPSSDKRLWSELQFPFGYPDAIDKIGTNAAPLLAGFAFTLIGLTLDKSEVLGESDLALLLLVVASIALVSSVQFNFTARQHYFSPGEYFDLQRLASEDGIPLHVVKREARTYLIKQRRWARYSRLSYNLGITVLFFGVASTLIPIAGIEHMAPLRATAAALLVVAGLAEAALMAREGIGSLSLAITERRPWL